MNTTPAVEIIDHGDHCDILYYTPKVNIFFVGGPADGIKRTYRGRPPGRTSAMHEPYVLVVQASKLFYAHAPVVDFLAETRGAIYLQAA